MEKSKLNSLVNEADPLFSDVREQIDLLDYFYMVKLNSIPLEKAAELDNTIIFSKDTLFIIREYVESFLVSEIASEKKLSIEMAMVEWKLMKDCSEKANKVVKDACEEVKESEKGNSLTLKEMSLETQAAFYDMRYRREKIISEMSPEMMEFLPISVIGMDIIKIMCLSHQARLMYEETNTKGYENVAMFSIIKTIIGNWLYPQDLKFKNNVNPNIPISIKDITSDMRTILDRDLKEYHASRREELEKFSFYLKEKNEDLEYLQ